MITGFKITCGKERPATKITSPLDRLQGVAA